MKKIISSPRFIALAFWFVATATLIAIRLG